MRDPDTIGQLTQDTADMQRGEVASRMDEYVPAYSAGVGGQVPISTAPAGPMVTGDPNRTTDPDTGTDPERTTTDPERTTTDPERVDSTGTGTSTDGDGTGGTGDGGQGDGEGADGDQERATLLAMSKDDLIARAQTDGVAVWGTKEQIADRILAKRAEGATA